ncbi:MAG: hypothetical protein CMO55_05705 [Verrucomicrobiales bacterium]|nr:hypothetical protein [Verrucomicrobiales bacterium]
MSTKDDEGISRAILATQERIRDHLAGLGLENAGVSHFGSVDIDPRYLAICVQVSKDSEAKVANREELLGLARTWLKEEGYPPEAADQIALRIDSEETVLRDYNGNWYHYYK